MNKVKLVIIDDNSDLRKAITENFAATPELEIIGQAPNGLIGLDMINRLQPDLVLLDIVMPQLDGFGVLDALSKMAVEKKPEVIVMTAMVQEMVVRRAIDAGAQYCIAKPFDINALRDRIMDLFMLHSPKPGLKLLQEVPKPIKRSLDEKISTVFITVGIPAHIKGYQFLREAIKMVMDHPEMINRITKELYPSIAQVYNTSSSKVERAIRHAIEVAWTRGKIENINNIFGYKVYGHNDKPTNGEFIALIADKLQLERAV